MELFYDEVMLFVTSICEVEANKVRFVETKDMRHDVPVTRGYTSFVK